MRDDDSGRDHPLDHTTATAAGAGARRGFRPGRAPGRVGRERDDRRRFEALYAAHGRRILAYAARRTAQPSDAADVVAEVFLVAWRRLDAVPPGDEAGLWLYGVARRVLANHRRSERRRDRLGARLAGALAEHLVPDPAEAGGTVDQVRAALALLPEPDREVIQLTVWEGLAAPQVAVVLGIPPATVRTRLHRARRRLRGLLAGTDGDDLPAGGRTARGEHTPNGDGGRHRLSLAGRSEHRAAAGHEAGDERSLVRNHEDQG